MRLSLAKLLLTAAGLLGGLPIGREGPSVQIAAGVMQHARRWLPERGSVSPHGLLVAGGAAGIAAAFNAPLAGITFAIEELTSKMEQRSSGLVISAIVLSGIVACGLAIAVIGQVSGGSTFGSGYESTRQLLEGRTDLPVLYATLRIAATWLATWTGVAGGLFAPCLAIGAGIGNDVALLTGWAAQSPALIALGMAGFLAAVTQAPITSFIIVMEMVDGHAMVLSLMAAALGASLIARWLAHPLYGALATAQILKLRANG